MPRGLSERHPLRVAVLGAGTMGHGLALLAATAGHDVGLVDIDPAALERALTLIRSHARWLAGTLPGRASEDAVLGRIRSFHSLEDGLASRDVALESIIEDPNAKARLFREVLDCQSFEGIVASNTSYLDVFSLAPEALLPRLAIAHFYAPPYIVPLVEVVGGQGTSPEVLPWLMSFLAGLGQRPVRMAHFIPGYIVNRLQRAMAREIFHLIDEGYASPRDIDEAVRASLGLRLPVLGVVQRYDFTGLDTSLKFLTNPSIRLISEDIVPRCLQEQIAAGHLGVKTGRGFYDYGDRSLGEIQQERDRKMVALRKFLEEEGILAAEAPQTEPPSSAELAD